MRTVVSTYLSHYENEGKITNKDSYWMIWKRGRYKIGLFSNESNTWNCMHEEIESRLNSEKVSNHSDYNLCYSRVLSQNGSTKIFKPIILTDVLYGRGTWSFVLREGNRKRAFENRVLRREVPFIKSKPASEDMGQKIKMHTEFW